MFCDIDVDRSTEKNRRRHQCHQAKHVLSPSADDAVQMFPEAHPSPVK
jgi:hypothetical protein